VGSLFCRVEGAKLRNRVLAVVLILAMLNMSLMVAVYAAQPVEQSKGGFNDPLSATDRGKPSNPGGDKSKPSGGIATGTVVEAGGNRYAIVIGINNYAGSSSDLQYCVNDAQEFKDALLSIEGWSTIQITYLVDGDASHDRIMSEIATVVGAAQENDEVVFFYSGHGSVSTYDVDGDGERKDECIIPVELTSSSWIWDGDLAEAFAECKSKRMMFYFDSCYAGGMIDLAGPNRLICMACGENQLSLESSAWQNGQFSYYFVDLGMKQRLANSNGDAYVTFEEAFDYAKANCQRQSPVANDGFTNDMAP
jgi:hypothetical protein